MESFLQELYMTHFQRSGQLAFMISCTVRYNQITVGPLGVTGHVLKDRISHLLFSMTRVAKKLLDGAISY